MKRWFLVFMLAATAQAAPRGFGKKAKVWVSPDSLPALFALASDAWKPKVAARTRGGEEVFAHVAPGTVVVRTAVGHGSGVILGTEGFILTNYHVISEGMGYDAAHRASVAKVDLGRLNASGGMELIQPSLDALFYAGDPTRDLALLRLAEVPEGLTAVPLATKPPRPGQDCAMLGQPTSGLLWTFRSCQVAGLGSFPGDMVDLVVRRLGASRRDVADAVAAAPGRRIVLSSCEANPGDSGGPLVDSEGHLIAVTFGVPRATELAKFTYHVHVDEVRAFLAARPSAPTVLAPDPWQLGPRWELRDVLGEGRAQILAAGMETPEEFLFDLDGDTDAALLRAEDPSLVSARKFDAEVVVHRTKDGTVVFYDTDNDGVFDLILRGRGRPSGNADEIFVRAGSSWEMKAAKGERLLGPEHFADPKLARRLMTLVRSAGIE